MKKTDWLTPINLATATLMGVALGIAIGGVATFHDPLRKWQTLIAGVLAIGAAFLTVAAMFATDRHQQNRHDSLVKLNLRADRLQIERAHDVLWKYENVLLPFSTNLDAFLRRMNQEPDLAPPPSLQLIKAGLEHFSAALNDPMVADAQKLFNANLVECYRSATFFCRLGTAEDRTLVQIANGQIEQVDRLHLSRAVGEIAALQAFATEYRRLLTGTRKLLQSYDN